MKKTIIVLSMLILAGCSNQSQEPIRVCTDTIYPITKGSENITGKSGDDMSQGAGGLAGAVMGAEIGMLSGGPVGAVIGGIVGAVSGTAAGTMDKSIDYTVESEELGKLYCQKNWCESVEGVTYRKSGTGLIINKCK